VSSGDKGEDGYGNRSDVFGGHCFNLWGHWGSSFLEAYAMDSTVIPISVRTIPVVRTEPVTVIRTKPADT
jgi:hypothetical protein